MMPTLWFVLVALMLAAYVVLDGFDIGAGIVYLFAGRSGLERRTVLRSIGPVWDGNEVWLLAAGGTLYFAFPLLYASSFSGFYLPLMMVLWLLMLRAIGIEFRTHLDDPVWQGFFDVTFSAASVLLAIFFGAALGNVLRGVPLGSDGYFFEPLFTNWRVGPRPGILDWYTVLTGVVALATLTIHGALYLVTKTEGELNARARRVALSVWPVLLVLTALSLIATMWIRPDVLNNYRAHPAGLLVPIVVCGALGVMLHGALARLEKLAFGASCAYIAGMLVGAAFALYPRVLPASTSPAYSLTIQNTAAAPYGLKIGVAWWIIGMVLALGYFVFIYRMFRGKVRLEAEEGY
jgi:cytochrome bd ubiquinol oxidase subunit II